MSRAPTIAIALASLCALLGACAALAPESSELPIVPHGGTGLFRVLAPEETGIRGTPRGRVLAASRLASDVPWVAADGTLYYAASTMIAGAPDADPTLPAGDVDWSVLPGRAIYRAPPREDFGYAAGELVLEAASTWEGGSVREPCAVSLPNGAVRLYYAGDGGIGVAEAPSATGAFTRIGDAPVVADPGARRPSATAAPDGGWLLYYELDGAILVAESADGVTFPAPGTPIPLPALELGAGDAPEVGVGSPGAATIVSGTGRTIVRLYHESRRADGVRLLLAAGSLDGQRFDRYPLPVIDEDDARDPAPRIVDARTTLLYLTLPREDDGRQVRAIVGAVAPRDADLDLPTTP